MRAPLFPLAEDFEGQLLPATGSVSAWLLERFLDQATLQAVVICLERIVHLQKMTPSWRMLQALGLCASFTHLGCQESL